MHLLRIQCFLLLVETAIHSLFSLPAITVRTCVTLPLSIYSLRNEAKVKELHRKIRDKEKEKKLAKELVLKFGSVHGVRELNKRVCV